MEKSGETHDIMLHVTMAVIDIVITEFELMT